MKKKYHISFPKEHADHLNQDEAYFFYWDDENNEKKKLRFHDYNEIYKIEGLYEQLFYDRLKCASPVKISSLLKNALSQSDKNLSELRILDLGAGNGVVGFELKKYGISRLIGVDILPEAKEATLRDRPGTYDNYYVCDFQNLDKKTAENIAEWRCNCLISVAALGFGDIPPNAFVNAFNIIESQGWVGFNIKETFLDKKDNSGFSKTIQEIIFSEFLDIYNLERYQHRLSIEGAPIYYYAIIGKKINDIPKNFLTYN
ncbi:class I SAM-dependent DNA methyltransferase [Candidatus Fonsibacter ubiquis]|jgi:SAM-dependent methyltransferase|uniref:class I SAM-dependent DNA methyltransferase n=1 Tax=Candidatus Fonsibacter ubiquis TaxID=1925548 RepID=UPI000C07C205|nr:class I SAM-dependent methyltransferase [Candidatus Fonsibacter ubiquis]